MTASAAPKRRGQLGYCSASLGQARSRFRGISPGSLGRKRKEAEARLRSIWRHNLSELCRVLDYNIETGILLYRISNELFPMAGLGRMRDVWDAFAGSSDSAAAAWKVRQYLSVGGRLTLHPKTTISIGSASKAVRKQSIADLDAHGRALDLLNLPRTHFAPINIHLGGGRAGGKNLGRIQASLEELTGGARERLVFENEDKAFWTWQNIASQLPGFPVTLDSHHHRINNQGESLREAADSTYETWGDNLPVRHVAEGARGEFDRVHHDWVATLPQAFLFKGRPATDIEIEARMKDLAVLHLKAKYGC